MSRRSQIALSSAERREYLAGMRVLTLCTHGPSGYPHAIAMWFDIDQNETVWMTTYPKSQKAVNIRRNPQVALSAESGEAYDTLKGVLLRGTAELIDDTEIVMEILRRVHGKMIGSFPPELDDAMRAQALKRVAIKVTPHRISSWDHSKLRGAR